MVRNNEVINKAIHPFSPSDESIRAQILTALTLDERTAGLELRVGVLNGIAHLAGDVESLEERKAAEDAAMNISGLRGVVNRIEAPGAPSPARIVNLNLDEGCQKIPKKKVSLDD